MNFDAHVSDVCELAMSTLNRRACYGIYTPIAVYVDPASTGYDGSLHIVEPHETDRAERCGWALLCEVNPAWTRERAWIQIRNHARKAPLYAPIQ